MNSFESVCLGVYFEGSFFVWLFRSYHCYDWDGKLREVLLTERVTATCTCNPRKLTYGTSLTVVGGATCWLLISFFSLFISVSFSLSLFFLLNSVFKQYILQKIWTNEKTISMLFCLQTTIPEKHCCYNYRWRCVRIEKLG